MVQAGLLTRRTSATEGLQAPAVRLTEGLQVTGRAGNRCEYCRLSQKGQEARCVVRRQIRVRNMGMVQKHPFSGNTRDLSADPDRSRVGAGLRKSLVAVLGLQFRENRVYPRSSSQ